MLYLLIKKGKVLKTKRHVVAVEYLKRHTDSTVVSINDDGTPFILKEQDRYGSYIGTKVEPYEHY